MKTKQFKILIVFASVLLISSSLLAYEVSSCGACSSPNSHPDAKRFYNKIKSRSSWTGNFYLEDRSCKQKYYKRVDMGGDNNAWIDDSDLHYHVGHGIEDEYDSSFDATITGIYFENGDILLPSEAYRCWGDRDLEWIGFRCCKMLNDASKGYWAKAMNKLHLICGFETNSYKNNNYGKKWAKNMIDGDTITQAWFSATDSKQPSKVIARVLAQTYSMYNDHLWGYGSVSPDPSASGSYWTWTHKSGSPDYLQVNNLSQMLKYEIVPQNVDESYVRTIGNAFAMPTNKQVVSDCDRFLIKNLDDPANPKILEVSGLTGHYSYRNNGKLFAANINAGKFSQTSAHSVAANFLNQNNLFPSDAIEYTVEWDTITEEDYQGNILNTIEQNTCVVWARQIVADGSQLVSVAGAGAKLKVYIDENGDIMGGMGNWRQIQPKDSIPVNNLVQSWSFFQQHGNRIAIEPAFTVEDYDEAVPNFTTATQVYYELPDETKQTELIPCWVLEVDFKKNGAVVNSAETFIPAKESYMPPVVYIDSPVDLAHFNKGDTINFKCTKIAGLGTPPFTFKWETSRDEFLSSQEDFNKALMVSCPDESLSCEPLAQTITVTVTDAKGIEASDSVTITVGNAGDCDECRYRADIDKSGLIDIVDFANIANRWLVQTGGVEPEQ